jgi:tellurite resistance protein TehA-like permease
MVSAATGALLIPYAPAGQVRLTLLLACYAMFGLSLLASVMVTTLIWYRLTMHKLGPVTMVPTLWIVLGWLGQSITAVNLLGGVAHLALPAPYSTESRCSASRCSGSGWPPRSPSTPPVSTCPSR